MSYYIEKIESESFNLWLKKNKKYYNIATLFYNINFCENEWNISNIEKSVFYTEKEIIDELENPLKEITIEKVQKLLSMKENSPQEIYEFMTKEKK